MSYKPIIVTYAGREQSLRAWVADNGAEGNYSAILKRWHNGIRDPEKLVEGFARPKKALTDAEKEWLEQTRFARAGVHGEWTIACDLIGWPRSRARELKEAMT